MAEEMLAGALIFMAGMLSGRFWPARRRRPRVKVVRPICGCEHHHSYHDPETGQCHGTMGGAAVPIRDEKGRPVKDSWGDVQTTRERTPCTCRTYSGPVPLPEYVAPEIAGT